MDAITLIIALYVSAWIIMFFKTFPVSMKIIKEVSPDSVVYRYRVIGAIAYAGMLFIACIPLFKIILDDDALERYIVSFTAGIIGENNV